MISLREFPNRGEMSKQAWWKNEKEKKVQRTQKNIRV